MYRKIFNKFSTFGIYWFLIFSGTLLQWTLLWINHGLVKGRNLLLQMRMHKYRHLVTSSTKPQPVSGTSITPQLSFIPNSSRDKKKEDFRPSPRNKTIRELQTQVSTCPHVHIPVDSYNEIKTKKNIVNQWLQTWLAQENRLKSLLN